MAWFGIGSRLWEIPLGSGSLRIVSARVAALDFSRFVQFNPGYVWPLFEAR